MKIKVCGLTATENVNQISELEIDYFGFIHYSGSKRRVADDFQVPVPVQRKSVHVFVNPEFEYVLNTMKNTNAEFVQLHGNESPEFCKRIQREGFKVIKAFSIHPLFDFSLLVHYSFCDYFLFDTKGEQRGGNGTRFNWNLLRKYKLNVSYFLSGGISISDANEILQRFENDEKCFAIDVNSRFESEPGLKDVNLVKEFSLQIKNAQKISVP